jgi:acetyl/propionyl-CoA carboxylase alpha subunit
LAKLIVWGQDRSRAIARMRRALSEYRVIGVRTTLPFARWLMEHPRFIAGDMSTDFIAEEWDTRAKGEGSGPSLAATQELSPADVAAVVGSLLMSEQVESEKLRRQPEADDHGETNRWRDLARWEMLRRM